MQLYFVTRVDLCSMLVQFLDHIQRITDNCHHEGCCTTLWTDIMERINKEVNINASCFLHDHR